MTEAEIGALAADIEAVVGGVEAANYLHRVGVARTTEPAVFQLARALATIMRPAPWRGLSDAKHRVERGLSELSGSPDTRP
jgi:hypothetical protein